MDCGRFLRTYSDYRDGLLDSNTRERVEGHLRSCRRCAHYHLALSKGVLLLRAAAPIEPSPRFRRRLRRNLALSESAPAMLAAGARMAAALLVAIAATLLVLEGVARSTVDGFAVRGHPAPIVVANPGVPFVGFARPTETGTGHRPVLLGDQLPDALNRFSSYAP